MAEQPSEREALSEVELIERAALRVGMKSLLNHGAASCVYSEGCAGVSQEHLVAFAREVALHCVAALSQPSTEQGWTHEINQELERQYLKGFQAGKAFAVSEQGWKPVDSGTMMTILVQLGFPMVNGEIVKRFRECEAVVLKVLSAKAQGYPALEGWAGVSHHPHIEPREDAP